MTAERTESLSDYADEIARMTDDELFAALNDLEGESEKAEGHTLENVLARIRLIEEAIETRYPGQALAPYKHWQRDMRR